MAVRTATPPTLTRLCVISDSAYPSIPCISDSMKCGFNACDANTLRVCVYLFRYTIGEAIKRGTLRISSYTSPTSMVSDTLSILRGASMRL